MGGAQVARPMPDPTQLATSSMVKAWTYPSTCQPMATGRSPGYVMGFVGFHHMAVSSVAQDRGPRYGAVVIVCSLWPELSITTKIFPRFKCERSFSASSLLVIRHISIPSLSNMSNHFSSSTKMFQGKRSLISSKGTSRFVYISILFSVIVLVLCCLFSILSRDLGL